MRIGLFSDSYHPQVNGIVYVIDITKKHLEAMGHEVFIFCPAETVQLRKLKAEKNVIRFRSIKGAWFDDYNMSVYFPQVEMRKIKKMNLDVIHYFTPSQIGLLGAYVAQTTGAVLVAQHSTDLANYIKHYPAVVPGLLIIGLTLPGQFKLKGKDVRELAKIYKPRALVSKWGQDIIESLMPMFYSKSDIVIALSKKSKQQLLSWQKEYKYNLVVMPTGIDALPVPSESALRKFRSKYGIADDDEVVLYAGRLSAEKNLDILIPTIKEVLAKRPKARLLYVGDFEYRKTLEKLAKESGVGDRITFTGSLPRQKLGVAYAAANLFAFPSMTDTQGLVLHEAAQAGLPIVLIDQYVSEVARSGKNALVAKNNSKDFAKKIVEILADDSMRERFSTTSRLIAADYGEYSQTKKLEKLYIDLIVKSKTKSVKKPRRYLWRKQS